MAKSSTDQLFTVDTKDKPSEKVLSSKKVDYLKGSIMPSTTIFFRLECNSWDNFIALLEPIHRFDIAGKSPSMPIVVNYEQIDEEIIWADVPPLKDKRDEKNKFIKATFTALSGLSYPTLLIHHIEKTTIKELSKKKQFLEDCGYVVIEGKLSFANIKKGND